MLMHCGALPPAGAIISMIMNTINKSNKRIAKNTGLLYLRMAIVMLINLYTVRLVLLALGDEDYGIFNVVAGVVTMLSSVTSVLPSATQRFYSYAMGEHNNNKLRDIFSTSINIYTAISVVAIIIAETLGLWFVNTQLNFPTEKMMAVNCLFQFSVISFIVSLLQCPYSASVIAHEDMNLFAYINVFECVVKMVIAYFMTFIVFDRLIYYGLALMLVPCVSFSVYMFLCKKRYMECNYVMKFDKDLTKELLSFSGWNLFASMASVGMNQVINILINIFFGPLANAARAISMQIHGAMNSLSSCFIMAIRPAMIKSYAEGSYSYLNKLFSISNKLIYYCMLVIVLPLFMEMDIILNLWLKTSEPMSIQFSKLIIIYITIMVMNNPISIIMQASGKVKEYFLPVESVTLLCPIVCYVLFIKGYPVEYSYYSMIGVAILSHAIRLYCLKKHYQESLIKDYFFSFVFPASIITIVNIINLDIIQGLLEPTFYRVLILAIVDFISISLLVYVIGLSRNERVIINSIITNILKKK